MEQKQLQHHYMLSRLSKLPKNMLQIPEKENLTEFVLHELAHPHCYNLQKAAYFIDNPDFDCFKGVAGYNHEEQFAASQWEHPEDFTHHMTTSGFNQKIRAFQQKSYRRSGLSDKQIVECLAKEFNVEIPHYYSWDMKHGNHGLLVYQRYNNMPIDEDIAHGICVLGFCPVF